jgi:triacylglycerol lipase
MHRLALLATLTLALLAAGPAPAPARPAAAPAVAPLHDPIVFVHGWNGNSRDWSPMLRRFRAAGWMPNELYTIDYPPTRSNVEVAQALRARVDSVLDATGATRVDLVTHSMGGLSSRHYLKELGGEAKVDAWVSLAGPNHGSTYAVFCRDAPCVEMRPESDFLTALNEGDETPGAVRYATWWSTCDELVDPPTSVPLAGATNVRTGCLLHSQILTDARVFLQVRDWIAP